MVGLRNRQRMEGHRRKPRRDTLPIEKFCGVQDRSKRKDRHKAETVNSVKKQGEGGTLNPVKTALRFWG